MQNFGQKRWFCDHEINGFHRTALKLGTSTRYYTGGLHAKFEANSFNITRVVGQIKSAGDRTTWRGSSAPMGHALGCGA